MNDKVIKCVIWDLDDTIWEGTLIEDNTVVLKQEIVSIIEAFDKLGILQSIASKNFYEDAINELRRFRIDHYFIYPKIGFINKSDMITEIISDINIGMDTVAFIDDQQYELKEVKTRHKDILCIKADSIGKYSKRARFTPKIITEDTKMRRVMYQNDIQRGISEELLSGPRESFLKTLDIKISLSNANKNDLDRMQELTERTNQLNTTGYTYSYEELNNLILSTNHILIVISVTDRFGSSGKVGLVLINKGDEQLVIDLFIMSCRVVSRGIGTMIINYLIQKAKVLDKKLYARFIPTGRNKMIQLSYVMAGFKYHHEEDGCQFLLNDFSRIQKIPEYIELLDRVEF